MIGHHDVLELHHIHECCTKKLNQIPVYLDSGHVHGLPWSMLDPVKNCNAMVYN